MVLKIVPSTDEYWSTALEEGLLHELKRAGALVASAGCSGCAEGQIGQNGPGEVTLTTGNRNFVGKWEWPGGKVDAGEDFATALHREVAEEAGLTIELTGLAGATSFACGMSTVTMPSVSVGSKCRATAW